MATDASDIEFSDNTGSHFTGTAVYPGRGLRDVLVAQNILHDGMFAGIGFASDFGDAPSTGAEVIGNSLADFGKDASSADAAAIRLRAGSYTGGLQIHFNRLVGTVRGINNRSAATVDAENNFFGCNAGPGTTACSSALNSGTGTLDTAPYLRLRLAVSPNAIFAGGDTASAVADVRRNSDGTELGAIPFPAVPIDFSADSGSGTPSAVAVDGVANATFTSAEAATATVTTVLVAATATAPIVVRAAPAGATGANGSAGTTGAAGAPAAPGSAGPAGATGARGPANAVLGETASSPSGVSIVTRRATSRRGRLTVAIHCPKANGICQGTLTLSLGQRRLAGAPFNLRGGATRKITLVLSRSARARLGRGKRVRLRAFARDRNGLASTGTRTLTLRAR